MPLLHRLRDRGTCFDAQQAYTRGAHPLQTALLDAITPGRGDCTLVAPHPKKRALTAVGQVSHRSGGAIARLTFLGPTAAIDQENGLRLLDGLASAVGQRGGHHLIAEVDEDSPAFESLRRAGFAVYARQRIWRLETTLAAEGNGASSAWRPEQSSDSLAINRLYLNVVPGLVQQVELPPAGEPAGLVHWQNGELYAYLDLARGPLALWAQPYLHPAVQEHDRLLLAAFNQLIEAGGPLIVCIRSYQGWMNATLERMGLARCADQAVMVKRLAAPVRRAAEAFLPGLETARPEPTAPFTPMSETTSMVGADQHTS
ncbi:MAG: hypothetical protein WBR18_14250 [Anaerolineales bacterium]